MDGGRGPRGWGMEPEIPVPLERAREWRARLAEQGRRVALTNGCFDLLHSGHVRLLTAARSAADALVVAVNDDASVARLKGPGRPLVPLAERAELLAALEPVDLVVAFGEDDPLAVILALRPDVLVKGADWPESRIVGAREVRGWGGSVLRVPLEPGVSTSALVHRIRVRLGDRDDGSP
ncbi:MAG: D-glycero-beta-D-manno-heptose 1-phosphate adenylyltransferase [Acidobacteria bacterium]|nr:MAG: D-glycero-beta-D-manno-heptose 1-phosphate adenylyltransferase [Acidobacteriota bacterium]